MKQSWNNIKALVQRMADKMPEENYRFKPTPEMQDFGRRMTHLISFNMRGCAQVMGDQKNVTLAPTASKAEVLTAMKDANAECDAAFNALTDTDASKTVTGGRGGPRTKLSIHKGRYWSTPKKCTGI